MFPQLSELKPRRKASGITQVELARLAGVSQSLLAKLESGKIDPSYSKVVTIFNALENIHQRSTIKASDIMSTTIHLVQSNEKLTNAIKIMKEKSISQMPVMEKNRLVGGVSEKSILTFMAKGQKITEKTKVSDAMEDPFPVVDSETPLDGITALLEYNMAIILSKRGNFVGLITKTDLLKAV